jgi:hypothetical protein
MVPTDDRNSMGTNYEIIEPPEITLSYEVVVVMNGAKNERACKENYVEIPLAPKSVDSQEMNLDLSDKFHHLYSTRNSLMRLCKDIDLLATEWYICTA